MMQKLLQEMERCKLELFELFQNEELATTSFIEDLKKIDAYYQQRFLENSDLQKTILQEYQNLITAIADVKKGSLSAEDGLKIVQELSLDRKTEIVVANIIKGCELLFWMAAALTSYVFCLGLAFPLIFLEPIIGVALTLGTSIIMLAATLKGADCVREFTSFNEVNKQAELERNSISFFTSSTAKAKTEITEEEEVYSDSDNFSLI